MKEFDLNEWYRRYHRYPLSSKVTAPHELRDLLESYKKFLYERDKAYEES